MKEFEEDNFKFDKNGRKFSKRVDNTVGKGEVAFYEQFLCFPVFSRQQTCINMGLYGKGLTNLKNKLFENIVGKVENAGTLLPQYFLQYQ